MGKKEIREYKSSSFSLLMREKEYAMQTYNVLNGTNYDNLDDLEVLDLSGGFSLTVRNDASFIVDDYLNVYEHQSTVNPNMPIRFLIYVSNLYKELLNDRLIYGKSLMKIPEPKFVVFYNGTAKYPERSELFLSDSYTGESKEAELELKCTVFNINPGFNEELKKKCPALLGYMVYVEKVRKNLKTMERKSAIITAIEECINEGVLVDFFRRNKTMIVSSDDIDCTYERQIEIATRDAHEEGIKKGIKEGVKEVISRALKNQKSPELIAEFIGVPLEEVLKVQKELKVEA